MKQHTFQQSTYILFLFMGFLWMAPRSICAQEANTNQATIQVIQDDRIDQMVQSHVQYNQKNKDLEGFRIQIFFDSGNNSKTNARSIYDAFTSKYPHVKAYLTFVAPNYKVRVGDFRTKLDAQRFLNELLPDYPNAWIIADQINLPQVQP